MMMKSKDTDISSLAYAHPVQASLTELSSIPSTSMHSFNHDDNKKRRSQTQQDGDANEVFQSQIKKTKKKQIIESDEEHPFKLNKKNALQTAPQVQKKKRGNIQNTNNKIAMTKNNDRTQLVSNLQSVQNLKIATETVGKELKDTKKSTRSSFHSTSSLSSLRSYSSQNRRQKEEQPNKTKGSTNKIQQGATSKSGQIQQQKNGSNFTSALSSIRNNGKNTNIVDHVERKYQEEKKKYELQLKLVRIKCQEFSKKCKSKAVDWKKIQKTQAKQKVQEKIGLINDGLRVQQNIGKTKNDIEQETSQIELEYIAVSTEMQNRMRQFEERVAPYELRMSTDISLRDQLLQQQTQQKSSITFQKQINSNIQEDSSSLSFQNMLLSEQIAALNAKKKSLLDQQSEIDQDNKQLKESADLKQQHLNILQKHYDEQASRSLWLKKEINMKKSGIFNINIISENNHHNNDSFNKQEINGRRTDNSMSKPQINGQMEICSSSLMDGKSGILNNQNKNKRQADNMTVITNKNCEQNELSIYKDGKMIDETIEYHYTCSINYLSQNKYELLRSIADFEYFTPNQVYSFFYSDSNANHFFNMLPNFITFFNTSRITNYLFLVYNAEGISNYSLSSSTSSSQSSSSSSSYFSTATEISFERVIEQIKSFTIDDSLLCPHSTNMGFSLHLEVTNQQFYLGKQFNIVISGINNSTSSPFLITQLKNLFSTKKITQSVSSTSESNNPTTFGNVLTNNNNTNNTNNNNNNYNTQITQYIERMQLPVNYNEQQQQQIKQTKNRNENISQERENKENVNKGNDYSQVQAKQNQQIKGLKKVKYTQIEQMISKNVKNINLLDGTPKAKKKEDMAHATSQNRTGGLISTGRRSQSENRSAQKGKEKKLLENLQKIRDTSDNNNNNDNLCENKNIINYIEQFFRKTNRLYTINFDSSIESSKSIE